MQLERETAEFAKQHRFLYISLAALLSDRFTVNQCCPKNVLWPSELESGELRQTLHQLHCK